MLSKRSRRWPHPPKAPGLWGVGSAVCVTLKRDAQRTVTFQVNSDLQGTVLALLHPIELQAEQTLGFAVAQAWIDTAPP